MGINIIMFNLTLFIIDFIIVWHITATIQSIYVHRAIAHTYIRYNPIIESLFRIWLWLIVAFNWPGWAKHFATHHRKHHRYADLKNDPHSPVHQTLKGLIKADTHMLPESDHYVSKEEYEKYAGNVTIHNDTLEHIFWKFPNLGVVLHIIIQTLLFGITGFVVGIIYAIFRDTFIAFVGKWILHKVGFNYANTGNDNSKILFPITFLLGGEELHTNHHNDASRRNFAVRWFEFDIGYWYCRLLVTFKLARWL